MSTINDDTFDEDEDQTPPQSQRRQPTEAEIRIWRKNAKKWEDAEPQLTQLQRENLILRTPGLNSLSERQQKALWATHDGDLNSESLRLTAQDLGFVAAPPPEVPDDETAAHQRLLAASSGATPAPGSTDELDAAKIATMTQEEVLAWATANGRIVQQ